MTPLEKDQLLVWYSCGRRQFSRLCTLHAPPSCCPTVSFKHGTRHSYHSAHFHCGNPLPSLPVQLTTYQGMLYRDGLHHKLVATVCNTTMNTNNTSPGYYCTGPHCTVIVPYSREQLQTHHDVTRGVRALNVKLYTTTVELDTLVTSLPCRGIISDFGY